MKILVDLSGFKKGEAYGSTTFVNELVSSLNNKNKDIKYDIIILCTGKIYREYIHHKNLQFHLLEVPENPFRRVLHMMMHFREYEKMIQPDIVFFPLNIVYKTKSICFVYIHDLASFFHLRNYFFTNTIKNICISALLLLRSMRARNKIYCPSEYTKKQLANFKKFDSDVVVLREGLPQLSVEPPGFQLNRNKKTLLLTSFRIKHKNINVFYEAMEILLKADEELCNELAIVLTGKKDKASDEVKERLQTINDKLEVRVTGFLPQGQLYSLISSCDAILYTTEYEGFGLPMVEAWEFKTNIFCSDIPPLRELDHKYAYFFSNERPSQLSDLIQSLMAGELIQKQDGNLNDLSWDNFAERLLIDFERYYNGKNQVENLKIMNYFRN